MNTTLRNKSFWLCLIALCAVLAALQIIGQGALARNHVRIDVHDELNYMNAAQSDYMQIHEDGLFGYLWETLHTFKSRRMLAKEPGTRLVSVPVILLTKGVNPRILRHYAFLWLIPAALLLYLGLTSLIRPVPALCGALLFALSTGTLGTFLHWYQEVTAIPAVCALILVVSYEARYGNRDDWGWLFTGIAIGAGFLTKISFVFIALWACGILFLMSGWLDNSRLRRIRILKAGLFAYFLASIWWPAHFPYVLRYASGPPFMIHGTLERGLEHFSMFIRTQFSYMYGFWISLLLLATAATTLFWFIRTIQRKQIRWDQAGILVATLVVPLGMIYFKKRYGLAIALIPLALGVGLCFLFLKKRKGGEILFSPTVAVFTALVVPLAMLYLRRFLGNSFNPRPYSVFIPLAAAAFALALDRITCNPKLVYPTVLGLLLLQGASILDPALRPDWKQDRRWVEPFHKTPVHPTDYRWLTEAAPLPEDGGVLRVGFVGNGLTFSSHCLAWGYHPYVARIETIPLARANPRNIHEPLPLIADIITQTADLDYVVIAIHHDLSEFDDIIGDLEGAFWAKENSLNHALVRALTDSAQFASPLIHQPAPGREPTLYVFPRLRYRADHGSGQ